MEQQKAAEDRSSRSSKGRSLWKTSSSSVDSCRRLQQEHNTWDNIREHFLSLCFVFYEIMKASPEQIWNWYLQ